MTQVFAFTLGFVERLDSEAFGRTHETDQDWNDAYDAGRELAHLLCDSDSGPQGENSRSEVEGEASQSGVSKASASPKANTP